MIRRLIEADYFAARDQPKQWQFEFWLLELRTPELLIETAEAHAALATTLESFRPLLTLASFGNAGQLAEAILSEEREEREADREYWQPLKAELEQLRRDRLRT